jgi:hypothetical protein
MNSELWLILLAGIGIIALTAGILRYFEQRRIKAMKAAGTDLGLTPLSKGERFNFLPVELIRKKGRGIGVGLKGNWRGHPILVFDLFHPAGKSVSIQTVLMTRFDHKNFPEFAAIERNANFYLPTVDLPPAQDAPDELKKHWLLYTRTSRWPFGAALNDWMKENRGRKSRFSSGWSFEGTNNALYVYRRGNTVKPSLLSQWLDEALDEAREFASRAEAAAPDGVTAETVSSSAERDLSGVKTTFRITRSWTIGKR